MRTESATAIQVDKTLFMQYRHKHFADDLPEVPNESFSNADLLTLEMNVTATGNSSSIPDPSQAGSPQVQTLRNVEMPEAELLNDAAVSDHLPSPGEVTPLRDEEGNEISQMVAAALKSELNALSN